MSSTFPTTRLLTVAILAVALGITGSAEARRKQAPPPLEPPPPVSLSPKLVEQASAYRAYVTRAAAISPAFADGAAVAQSLRSGASYEPQQLLRGAIAYGAVAALQDQAFVAGVRIYVKDPDQRRAIAYEIMKDPAYAVGISGAPGAAGLVLAALGADGRALYDQGVAVKQAAYDVQHSAWSKADVVGRENRLRLAKLLSATPLTGEPSETARLQLAVVGGAPMSLMPAAARPPYTPLVVRSLAVAALAALGYGGDAALEQVMPLMAEPNSANCLNMSKLNLYQCLAVAKPHYEDVFCLGQHVMMDTGRCLMRAVGAPLPIEVYPRPLDVKKVVVAPAKGRGKAKPKKR